MCWLITRINIQSKTKGYLLNLVIATAIAVHRTFLRLTMMTSQ
jgi:hypothetical protein